MRNVTSEAVSYLDPGLIAANHARPEANTREIISGYVTPEAGTDKCPKSDGPVRKRVGILYADVVGSDRPVEQSEANSNARLGDAVKIVMTNIADNGGRLIGMDGRAILAEFKDTDQALHCAINVQLAARQWNANLPFERQLLFRTGVSQGDSMTGRNACGQRSRYLAACLEKLAAAGGISISEAVRACLDDRSSVKLVAGGKQYVKDLCVPVESFWIQVDTEQFVSESPSGTVKVTLS